MASFNCPEWGLVLIQWTFHFLIHSHSDHTPSIRFCKLETLSYEYSSIMGNALSILPAALRNIAIRVQNWYWGVRPYSEQCAVCWENKRVFKKMHRSERGEQPHFVCLDCHRAWVRACNTNRASYAPEERLICPICVEGQRPRCYTLSMSVYVACWACQQLKKSEPFLAHGGRHVAERHPGCTLCWECIREATQCPMCHRQGPLIERPIHESVWGEAQ